MTYICTTIYFDNIVIIDLSYKINSFENFNIYFQAVLFVSNCNECLSHVASVISCRINCHNIYKDDL